LQAPWKRALWYVALMSASPTATPVTMPALTAATAVLDDCQVASGVTDLLEVSESAAVAVNCAAPPTAGAVPLTVTAVIFPEDETDGDAGCVAGAGDGVVGELLHAAETAARPKTSRHDARDTRFTSPLCRSPLPCECPIRTRQR